jgi:HEAT repeat protein
LGFIAAVFWLDSYVRRERENDRIDELISMLKDPKDDVRLKAFSELQSEAIRGLSIDSRTLGALIDDLTDKNRYVRKDAADALLEISKKKPIRDPRAVAPLIAALNDTDQEVAGLAAEALGQIKDPRAVEPLIAALKDKDASRAALALGEIKDPRAVAPLIAALKDTNEEVACWSAEALGHIKDPRAVEPLIAALKNKQLGVDEGAAEALMRWQSEVNALVEIKDPRAVEPLMGALKDMVSEHRYLAAEALGDFGDARAVEPLIAALKDKEELCAKNAAEALGKIGPPAVEPLIAALKRANPGYRLAIDNALSNIGTPAVDALLAALKDANPNVRLNAAYSLSAIKDTRADNALLTFEERNLIVVARNYLPTIAKGAPGTEALLVQALTQFGNSKMALDFIVCGNDKLKSAGTQWASEHGYYVKEELGYGGSSVVWGSAY